MPFTAADDLCVCALKLFRLATFRELSFFGRIGQTAQFLLQILQNTAHVVDGLLHLFVVAFVSVGNQLVDFAARNLGEDTIAFPDRQQDRVQHGVDAFRTILR